MQSSLQVRTGRYQHLSFPPQTPLLFRSSLRWLCNLIALRSELCKNSGCYQLSGFCDGFLTYTLQISRNDVLYLCSQFGDTSLQASPLGMKALVFIHLKKLAIAMVRLRRIVSVTHRSNISFSSQHQCWV